MVWSRGLIACGRVGLAGILATQEVSGSVSCDFKDFCCVGWLWPYPYVKSSLTEQWKWGWLDQTWTRNSIILVYQARLGE
jgi:hypothetical protein